VPVLVLTTIYQQQDSEHHLSSRANH